MVIKMRRKLSGNGYQMTARKRGEEEPYVVIAKQSMQSISSAVRFDLERRHAFESLQKISNHSFSCLLRVSARG
jgi:hypothetical protein